MPRWDLHIACGISVTVLYVLCASFPFLGSHPGSLMDGFNVLALPLSIGAFSLLVGSILPDIDGRGRIRWVIGPVIGALALTMTTADSYLDDGITGALSHLGDDGALLFLAGTAIGYGSLLVPMRHRGAMHGIPAAAVFSIACAAAFLLIIGPIYPQGALVGAMAFSGYGWHLALDGSA